MAPKIDQKEYLKRYLSNDKEKKKKKKKEKKPTTKSNVRIIDDDLDLSKLQTLQEDELEQFALDEDAPQIAGIVDERPPELRAKEDFSTNKWKVVAANESPDSELQVSDRSSRMTGFEMRTTFGSKQNHPDKRDRVSRTGKGDSDNDASPPRRRRKDSDESPPRRRSSKERRRRRDSSDESPPRKATTQAAGRRRSPEEARRARRADSDESPSRKTDRTKGAGRQRDRDNRSEKQNKRNDSDVSPQRKRRPNDSDESPPRRKEERRKQARSDSDESPPRRREERRKQARSDSDESPPRLTKRIERNGKRDDQSSRTQRRAQDSDESPPRKNHTRDVERGDRSRRSPPAEATRKRFNEERSPRRKQYETGEVSSRRREASPALRIKQERQDSDESPPRRRADDRRSSRDSHVRIKQEPRSSTDRESSVRNNAPERMTKTLDGKRAGLQDARSLRAENEAHRQREREAFANMSTELSGRYAETVVREKSGRRRDIEKELREELEKKKHDEKKKQIYDRWGKGVKQVEDYNAQLQEAAREMEKPLARYADDKDLDEYLKQQERDGDPMLEYLRSKRKEENKRAGVEEKPAYQGAFPENRFGIRPGYRWDGVDRSNGFERRWFEMVSKKKATEEEAYKYSVEDM